MKNPTKINKSIKKSSGFILTSEAVMLSTVLVIGLTAGLVTVRDAMNSEMEDVAEAIGSLDQSYAFQGIQNAESSAVVDGSSFGDGVDTNAGDELTFEFISLDETEGRVGTVASSGGSESADRTGVLTP